MYYSQLSKLSQNHKFSNEDIKALDEYLHTLSANVKGNITAAKFANQSEICIGQAIKILMEASKLGILKQSFSIVCPECGFHIERIENLVDIPETKFCYNCEQDVFISPEDVEVKYEIVVTENFYQGQRSRQMQSPGNYVDPYDSLKTMLDSSTDFNKLFYNPTEKEYRQLQEKFDRIFVEGRTKEKGDRLEELVIDLFSIGALRAKGVRTTLNQIDCYVRNTQFTPYGIFDRIGSRYVIECKNEKGTPSGTYISKLEGIISEINGRDGDHVKLGIIVSKEKAPSTYLEHAKLYHATNGTVSIIAICAEEIGELIKNRGNLLELIERKVDEVVLYTKKGLKKSALYSA